MKFTGSFWFWQVLAWGLMLDGRPWAALVIFTVLLPVAWREWRAERDK